MNDFIRWKVIVFGLFSSLELCFCSMFSEEKITQLGGPILSNDRFYYIMIL